MTASEGKPILKNTAIVDRPINGPFPELAREVRNALGWLGNSTQVFSTRMASRKTGVSYGTIVNMASGERPKADTIVKFTKGLGVSPEPLLKAAGYLTKSPLTSCDTLLKVAKSALRDWYARGKVSAVTIAEVEYEVDNLESAQRAHK